MQQYETDRDTYRAKFERWDRQFGRVGPAPELPSQPYYLRLWHELQRWPNHLLIAGGLYDQPSWTWEMIDLAGSVYLDALDRREKRKDAKPE